jgi:hypothetical protein
MRPRSARAQTEPVQRFIVHFMPNGTDPARWNPPVGAVTEATLPECLRDLSGFGAEGEWPASEAVYGDITWVTNLDHDAVVVDIHNPSMALSAHHARGASPEVTPQPTLDQVLANHIQADTPFRSITFSATGDTAVTQGFLSFREGGQPESVYRSARDAYATLFASVEGGDAAMAEVDTRRASLLDWVRKDAELLGQRLGASDRERLDQYLQSVFELERQLSSTPAAGCSVPELPAESNDLHGRFFQMSQLGLLAMQCDLTRVLVLQYSNSWDLEFSKYELGDGVGDWSDHFISHKLGDKDRATDLDALPAEEALAIANARVVQTSRFKARRFANLINALKAAPSGDGSLFDESLVLHTSENGDGDSHSRYNVPIMLSGALNGFERGRSISADGAPTGALHASILNHFGIETPRYGDPEAEPLAGF